MKIQIYYLIGGMLMETTLRLDMPCEFDAFCCEGKLTNDQKLNALEIAKDHFIHKVILSKKPLQSTFSTQFVMDGKFVTASFYFLDVA